MIYKIHTLLDSSTSFDNRIVYLSYVRQFDFYQAEVS